MPLTAAAALAPAFSTRQVSWSRWRVPLRAIAAALAMGAAGAGLAAPAAATGVSVRGTDILVDGKPFAVNGASGRDRLAELKGIGAKVIRTYGEEPGEILDAAQRAGLKVIVGFWMEHPRRGFDYGNPGAVQVQLDALQKMVERYRTHPALLMWGIGNEVETELSPAQSEAVWSGIEQAARLTKSLDPDHPVMAVLADAGQEKVAALKRAAPSVDVLGLNAYGDSLLTIVPRARAQGWTGPIVITEMGAIGQWTAAHTPWGAAIEPTSTEKADKMQRYLAALKAQKVGALPFLWGQKQEVTPTWHSLFLPTGEYTETVQVMADAFGGTLPDATNHAPRIMTLRLNGPLSVEAKTGTGATLAATDPDGDALKVEWKVMAETAVRGVGGDAEPVPATFRDAIHDATATSVKVYGLEPGRYRIFVTVRDGRGAAATGNLPFEVR
ncbi:glycoside hydrolase family 2 TIM barrel-domain containing protein [Azorhizobium doebereinerae]|uniref:glycoside hydrolase family 2 TIM barrel-domain containing protein n=1 Tax=Azorhizobium doebereinerae TaxID=281091 RepID=UPI001FD8D295|nr:glycoside hydrolase family 2 TIM barrel-domain containing protein [Azorhizobium doebereinerae]